MMWKRKKQPTVELEVMDELDAVMIAISAALGRQVQEERLSVPKKKKEVEANGASNQGSEK